MVKQLDDDRVEVREKATDELVKLGRFALPGVRQAMAGKPSAEVRSRIERLILAPISEDDFNARSPVFLADTKRKFKHDFLGWSELVSIAGDTEHTRALFADILADEKSRPLLLAVAKPEADALAVFQARWKDYGPKRLPTGQWQQGTPALHDVAALLLAQTRARVQPAPTTPGTASMGLRAMLKTEEGGLAAAGKGKYGAVFQAICRRWVETREGLVSYQMADSLCGLANLGDELRTAIWVKLVRDQSVKALVKQQHLMLVAGAEGRKRLELFRQLLADDTRIWPGNPNDESQLRDMALVAAVLVTDQNPKDYGYTVNSERADQKFWDHNYRFVEGKGKTVDDLRKAAFAKWAEWETANAKPGGNPK